MPEREKVSNQASPGQVGEVLARIAPLINYTNDEVLAIMTKSGNARFRREAVEFLAKFKQDSEQERFYKEVLGMDVSLKNIRIPYAVCDINMPLILHEELVERFAGLPIDGLFQLGDFPKWKYMDEALDTAIPTHERHPRHGSYAILVRDVQEADEENANLSASDVSERKMFTETILERIFHELFYFWKTGEHLDTQNWTLCSGSRGRGGDVPGARWGGGFSVDGTGVSSRDSRLRSRRVLV